MRSKLLRTTFFIGLVCALTIKTHCEKEQKEEHLMGEYQHDEHDNNAGDVNANRNDSMHHSFYHGFTSDSENMDAKNGPTYLKGDSKPMTDGAPEKPGDATTVQEQITTTEKGERGLQLVPPTIDPHEHLVNNLPEQKSRLHLEHGKTDPKTGDAINEPAAYPGISEKDKEIPLPSDPKKLHGDIGFVVVEPPCLIDTGKDCNMKPSLIPTPKLETSPTSPVKIIPSPTPRNRYSPSPKQSPLYYMTVKLIMSWREFCVRIVGFQSLVVLLFRESSTPIKIQPRQVVVRYEKEHCGPRRHTRGLEIFVEFYIADERGDYNEQLTKACIKVFNEGIDLLRKGFADKILEFKLSPSHDTFTTARRPGSKLGTGITIAIVIATIAGFCLLGLLILQVLYRRRSRGKKMQPSIDVYGDNGGSRHNTSLDSMALSQMSTHNRYPIAGFLNPGLETTVDKQLGLSNKITFCGIKPFNLDMEALDAEFRQLPNNMPRLSEVPPGAEGKNRYANVIPIRTTRVMLKSKIGDLGSEYINANFVRGFKNTLQSYIATQAPTQNTVEDFWRMVWEQQVKVILMLTGIEENGVTKCEEYFPRSDGGDNTRMFGDFMVVLKRLDVRREYTLASLTLKDVERNLCRDVSHFWFTSWPSQGVPKTPIPIIQLLLHVQAHQHKTKAPEIVHCSPGTGRTGTVMAIDICMRSFEETGTADILNTVYKLRQDRAGSVQTKEQYAFIYRALNEYALLQSDPTSLVETRTS